MRFVQAGRLGEFSLTYLGGLRIFETRFRISLLVLNSQMKYKLSRQQQDDKPPAIVELPSATHDTLAKLEKQVSDLQEEIALERQRNAALQKKIKTLTSSAAKERKKCMKVIRLLAERVERLNAQVARTSPNGHLPNGKNGLNVIKMAPDDGDSNPWRPMGLNDAALSDDNV